MLLRYIWNVQQIEKHARKTFGDEIVKIEEMTNEQLAAEAHTLGPIEKRIKKIKEVIKERLLDGQEIDGCLVGGDVKSEKASDAVGLLEHLGFLGLSKEALNEITTVSIPKMKKKLDAHDLDIAVAQSFIEYATRTGNLSLPKYKEAK